MLVLPAGDDRHRRRKGDAVPTRLTDLRADAATPDAAPAAALWPCLAAPRAARPSPAYFPVDVGLARLGRPGAVSASGPRRRAGRGGSTSRRGSAACRSTSAVLQWLRVADPMHVLRLGLPRPLLFAATSPVRSGAAAPASTGGPGCRWRSRCRSALVVMEYVRWQPGRRHRLAAARLAPARLPGGFAWYLLGHTQHDFLALIQIADLGGAYAVTFVVAAVNGLLVRDRSSDRRRGRRTALVPGAVASLVLLLASLGYGSWQTRRGTFASRGRRSPCSRATCRRRSATQALH